MRKYMKECMMSHKENGDMVGARAIQCAMIASPRLARQRYPEAIDAIENAIAYARQQSSPDRI